MPFVEYKIQHKPMGGGTGLSVSLRKAKLGDAKMMVFLSAALASRLAWAVGDSIQALLGTDGDHGMIRIRKNGDGTAVVASRSAGKNGVYFCIALGAVPGFVNRTEPKRYCKFEELEEGWVEIVLPAWADETHPEKRKVAAPSSMPRPHESVHRPALGRRTISVTSQIQGDPPIGRSALSQTALERHQQNSQLRQAEDEGRRASEEMARAERREQRGASNVLSAIKLSATERGLLAGLATGKVQSRHDLIKAAGGGITSVNSISAMVSGLRKKLRLHGISIDTVDGGFQMKPEMCQQVKSLTVAAGRP